MPAPTPVLAQAAMAERPSRGRKARLMDAEAPTPALPEVDVAVEAGPVSPTAEPKAKGRRRAEAPVAPAPKDLAPKDPAPKAEKPGAAEAGAVETVEPEPKGAPQAARWDAATGQVTFDWPAIEQVAAQGGPNQGMANLLLAARAEGANSRWPF